MNIRSIRLCVDLFVLVLSWISMISLAMVSADDTENTRASLVG